MDFEVIATVGLPASGKSTWAKAEVRDSYGRVKRVNKDDLRAMIDNSEWSEENERAIEAARDALVECFLALGFSVVCDDTNLYDGHLKRLQWLANEYGATFRIEDFRNVSVEECIKRDRQRIKGAVGEDVIRRMHERSMT